MMAVATKNSQEDFGFGDDDGPEDVQIADRGKPKPIDQEVGHKLPSKIRQVTTTMRAMRSATTPPLPHARRLIRIAIFLVRPVSLMLILLRCRACAFVDRLGNQKFRTEAAPMF